MKRCFQSSYEVMHEFFRGNYEAYTRNVYNSQYGADNLPTCYSYGSHYALIIKDHFESDFCPTYLLKIDGYSVTTSKHISIARSFLRDRQYIETYYYFYEKNHYDRVIKECLSLWQKSKRCRVAHRKNYFQNCAIDLYNNYQNFIKIKAKNKRLVYGNIPSENVSYMLDCLLFETEKKDLKEKKRQALQYIKDQKKIIKSNKFDPKKNYTITIIHKDCISKETVKGTVLKQNIVPFELFMHYSKSKTEFCLSEVSSGCMVTCKSTDISIAEFKKQMILILENKKDIFASVVANAIALQKNKINGGNI